VAVCVPGEVDPGGSVERGTAASRRGTILTRAARLVNTSGMDIAGEILMGLIALLAAIGIGYDIHDHHRATRQQLHQPRTTR